MSVRIISKSNQAYGAFNNGQIVENKPIGFPQDGGFVRPYSNLFYWARAKALVDSTIGLHPHQGFEIMSFVLKGRIKHFDTKMNAWKELSAGDVQIIRSGNGISHAEHLFKDAVIFQIWLDPNLSVTLNKDATYDDYPSDSFPVVNKDGFGVKTFIGETGPIELDAPSVQIQSWDFEDADSEISLEPGLIYSFYVLDGSASLNENNVQTDDFIIIEEEKKLVITGTAKLFLIKVSENLNYTSYSQMMEGRMQD